MKREAARKDHTMKGKSAELLSHLQSLLTSYDELDYGRQLNPVDAFFAYRLLLGRNPNLAEELPRFLKDRRIFREFLDELIHSDEFSLRTRFFPPNRIFMAELPDFRLWFNTTDRDMGMIMISGQYEPVSVELLKRLISPGMKCIDVGAHIGFYTCLVASIVGETGKVYSFEPMSSHYDLLLKNIQENGFQRMVKAFKVVCSDVNGNVNISKTSNMFVVGYNGGSEQATAKAVRLDDLIEGTIDFVKIDVEGHEPAVIRGMTSILSRDQPIIVSEINEYWLRNCSQSSAAEYVGLLTSLGYDVFDVRNLDCPLREDSLKLDVLDMIDVVAFPPGRAR
jgi:FkbM family methyltransferase